MARLWTTRLISLAVYAALFTTWTGTMPRLTHVKSTVRIESDLPQSELLRQLSDAGIDAKEIKISKTGPFGPLATFVSLFFSIGLVLGTFLAVHTIVKAAVAKWFAPADEHLLTPDTGDRGPQGRSDAP